MWGVALQVFPQLLIVLEVVHMDDSIPDVAKSVVNLGYPVQIPLGNQGGEGMIRQVADNVGCAHFALHNSVYSFIFYPKGARKGKRKKG